MPTIGQIALGLVLSSGRVVARTGTRRPEPKSRRAIPHRDHAAQRGFTRWGKIELDDEEDVWEIDDAHASDGHRYDLRLQPDTPAILTREPYDD